MILHAVPLRKTLAGLLFSGICSGLIGTGFAHAALAGCRKDPIVLLSNGTTIQLYADIYDAAANINSVDFVLHAPVGTTVASIVYPPDMAITIPETFQLIADGTDAKYSSTTFVADANVKVTITTYAIATAPSGAVSKTFAQNGHVNQLVNLTIKQPK